MIKDAMKEHSNFIITDDSSRLARTKKAAVNTKQELRSYGINIKFVSDPFIDPK